VLMRARRVIDEHNPLLEQINIEGLRADGKRQEAMALTQAAVRRYPGERSLKFTEASLLAELQRFDESIELLNDMARGRPEDATDDATVYLLLSNVQIQADQLTEAAKSVQQALVLNPNDAEILLQLSRVQQRKGAHAAAEQTLRNLLQRQPDHATALNNVGYFLLERGERYEEALQLIEQALAIEPNQGSFWDSLGWAQYKLGHNDKARVSLEKALTLTRRNATIYEHLGDVLREQGRLAEARRHWSQALEYAIEAGERARLKEKLKDGY
jgi:Tfp pilus assembly protein PilF